MHPLIIPATESLSIRMVFDRMRAVHADTRVHGASRSTSYGELADEVLRLATVLRDDLEVGPGVRVATFGFNSIEHLALYFAVPLLGAVLHTLNVRLHAREIAEIIDDAQDAVIFFDAGLEPTISEALMHSTRRPRLVRLGDAGGSGSDVTYDDLIASARPLAALPDVPEDAVLGLCYSSGTTGRPKGVPTTHRAMVLHSFATGMRDVIGLSESDVILPVVPMFHAFGWGLPYSAPFVGAALALHGEDNSPENLARVIDDHGVTVAAGVPTIWRSLLPLLESGACRAPRLRLVFAGGSASPAPLIEAVEAHGIEYLQIWGMTETGPIACVSRPRPRHEGAAPEELLSVKERTGTVIPGVDARITDEEGREVAWDGESPGELEVRGPWIISEYFGDGHEDRFHDGWLRTGDVAVMEPDGYMRIVDRAKDLIKSGGEWIGSLQLEAAIRSHPDVADVAVVGVPSHHWDERPVAVLVLREGRTGMALDDLHAHLSGAVPRWWLPDDVAIVDRLPLTSVGKVDKRAIRDTLDLQLD